MLLKGTNRSLDSNDLHRHQTMRQCDLLAITPELPNLRHSTALNKWLTSIDEIPIVDELALHDSKRSNWFANYHAGLVDGSVSPLSSKIPTTIRRLTVKECAAIQTFPVGYKFCGTKTKQYKQIGNAVPCLFAEAVAKSVRDAFWGW